MNWTIVAGTHTRCLLKSLEWTVQEVFITIKDKVVSKSMTQEWNTSSGYTHRKPNLTI